MPFSSVIRETEEVLEGVLRIIREEYDDPYSVLCEIDRIKFEEEEESLRERLKQTVESEAKDSWRSLFGLSSPQAAKCLKDAKDLRQSVKEHINAKVRTKLIGRSNLPPSPGYGRDSALNLMGARTSGTDARRPLAGAEQANTIITSPLNMDCSPAEFSELNDNDYTSDLNEAINTPLQTSSDRSRDSPPRRRRRSPPPPPPRRMLQPSNSQLLSEATSNPGGGSARRSNSDRRAAPSPPQLPRQSRTPSSPLSSVVQEILSGEEQGRRGMRYSGDHAAKINNLNIRGSSVVGMTLNNGGCNNSGAVVHKTAPPLGLPQHPIPRF